MMLFLLHYDRSKSSLVSMREFPDKDIVNASAEKLRLEIGLLGGAKGQEVVLLEAGSREALQKTHARYFETLDEIRDNSGSRDGGS